jgi:excisionase family DNA binding protein
MSYAVPMDKRGYRIPDAVAYTGRPRSAIYVAIQDGSLRSYKIGKSRLILREDLDDWLDQQTAKAVTTTDGAA